MECEIMRRGQVVGKMCAEADGLYWNITASIAPSGEVLRLYAPGKLGVFVPEAGRLVCRRRISRAQLPMPGPHAIAWCEQDGQWTQAENGQRVRYLPEGMELAVRWQREMPMAFPDAPGHLRLIELEGAPYLCCLRPFI